VNDDCIQSELRQHADRVQQNRRAAGRAGGDITQDHGQEAPRGAALTHHRHSPHARLTLFAPCTALATWRHVLSKRLTSIQAHHTDGNRGAAAGAGRGAGRHRQFHAR